MKNTAENLARLEPCLCGATDCPQCRPYDERARAMDLADRMAELRVEHLWSAEGYEWFKEFTECNASVKASGALHKALCELDKHPRATDPMSVALRRFAKAAEQCCADNDEPWIREVAESEMEDA